jgi:hypothetical protein
MKFEDAYIELIEDFPCNSKKELHRQEGVYIRNNDCVNKCIAGRPKEESSKIYRETHKKQLAERMRKYRANHPEVAEWQKQYHLDHKEHLNAVSRQYYYDHKQVKNMQPAQCF